MECTCMIDADDVDCFATILSDTRPIARKEHHCGECGKVIPKGKKYRSEVMVTEGYFSVCKTCLICNELREALVCSFYYGEIMQMIEEEINNYGIPEHCIAELTPEARSIICEMIEESWKDED